MLPQIKDISFDYSLWLDDDQYPEQYHIRFDPVLLSLCEFFRLVYDTGYGPESLMIICERPDSLLIMDESYCVCQINPFDQTEDITDDLASNLSISEFDAEQIALCLPSLLAALNASVHRPGNYVRR